MYLSDRRSPWSLHEVLPHAAQVKLVLQIRDPVTRTLSGFRQGSPGDTVDEFAAVTSTELHLLHHCYNSSLQLAHPSPKTTGDSSNPFGITCNTGHHQYAALYRCVSALAESADGKALTQDRPWFQHFTRKGNKELLQQHVSLKLLKKYEGHVHRSIYVDQLINFLCAGFRPDQFIVVTTTELKADAEGVLHRIATALDRPSQLAAQARKRVLSGIHANMHRHSHTMPDAMERELQEFFQPYNQRLLDVLDFYGFVFNRTAMIHELNLQQ
ncbi:hypothetical protein PTSG_01965 [Salpingoeca rosetta]|uniref:Sulfotransferase domain-containing protein n=1 Tax=Salpingoeca rosetta (strain ATCC 50818 / BSB-021) TaxID=946362 RepID=F2TZH0_SALR5|nr:uncharacterized protein PTSG_01965 [Salpingoeca rosetta]EGD78994.1 hypothetical protein PTSG_01965 [Salpingoeca rosetta]|eukprot:XP_004997950.1 hypothetical protein PTSG_01965 [Salpingoeca rosetta]